MLSGCVQYIFLITVHAPNVVVIPAYTTRLYAGSSLTLTCTVTLDPNVDNDDCHHIMEWSK